MRFVLWLTTGIMFLIIGCASNLRVTYYSDPPGALLYQGEQRWDYTPFTLQYKITEENKRLGYVVLRGTQVRWASGASASIEGLRAYLNVGRNQQFTFIRPQNFPGREIDIQFVLELEKISIMRQQLTLQNEQLELQRLQTIWQQNQTKTMNCTSQRIGDFIYTNCH